MKTSDGPKLIKSGVKPPKPDGSKANRPLINENELTEWIAYWDDLESHWFFWNKVKDGTGLKSKNYIRSTVRHVRLGLGM